MVKLQMELKLAVNGDDTDEHMVAFVNYTIGMVTLGYSEANIDRGAEVELLNTHSIWYSC